MPPFYVTTPIYYVNDVPHIGHAYTTIAGDVARPLAPAAGRRRLLPHRHRRARPQDPAGRRGARAHPAGVGRPHQRALPRGLGQLLDITNDDFIRTTEPRHHAAVQEFLQRVYDNGDIELGTYEGLYCVACEAYYTEDELVDGNCARSTARPVERVTEENYFFKLSALRGPPARRTTRRIPRRCSPRRKRNEVLGFIKQGLRDFSISRTSITWGIPLPWDPKPRHLRLVRRAHQLLHRRRATAPTASGSTRCWPADYHLIGKDILRFHAVYWPAMLMAAGDRAAAARVRARLAAGRRREDEQDAASTRSRPPISSPTFGVDGFRYHFLARPALRPRRRLQLRGDGRPLQRRPRQQLRQPRQPRAEHGRQLLRRRRRPTRATTVRSSSRRRPRSTGCQPRMDASSTSRAGSARCGTSSATPTPTSRTGPRGR